MTYFFLPDDLLLFFPSDYLLILLDDLLYTPLWWLTFFSLMTYFYFSPLITYFILLDDLLYTSLQWLLTFCSLVTYFILPSCDNLLLYSPLTTYVIFPQWLTLYSPLMTYFILPSWWLTLHSPIMTYFILPDFSPDVGHIDVARPFGVALLDDVPRDGGATVTGRSVPGDSDVVPVRLNTTQVTGRIRFVWEEKRKSLNVSCAIYRNTRNMIGTQADNSESDNKGWPHYSTIPFCSLPILTLR